ncbi:MAG: peptidoglycan DD-metalloendopeptidase family protein, partial [Acaryochloris sp. SU_5_25]|nr:peptidoglycan DD-metalloendopeptidase family protein [Acaryochloris sp. SU_5_25]
IIEGVVQGDWEQVRKRAQAVLVQRGTEITLKELYKEVPELKNLPLGAVPDLVNQPIEQTLPKVVDLAIEEIPGAEDELINSVPGLSEIPMNKLPFDLAFSFLAGDVFARFDIAYSGVEGKEEPSIQHSLSGGSEDQKFRPIKCTLGQTKNQRADNCPHFEMRKFVSSPLAQITGEDDIDGKQWVQGDSGGKNGQGVKGGKGLLKWVNGGWEPAGIHPFGTGSHTKFVLKRITEHPDKPSTAKLYLAIQFCATAPIIGEQCTPHFLVIPTPFTVREGGLFLVASRRSLPAEIAKLRDQALSSAGLNQVYCDPNQLVAAVGQVDNAEAEAASQTQSPKPDRLAGLSESELQQHRARQYLARIARGETDNGTNVGDRATAESVNGPYGIYQFKYSSRNSLLQRQGIDAWSADPEEQAQAAWAWIQIIGNEEGVDLHQAIAAGDFETADQVLGKGQFTSLPGGAEASRHWSDPGKLEQYGPNGQAPDVGTAPLPTSPGGMPCNPATVAGVPGAIGPEGDGVSTGRFISPVNRGIDGPFGQRWGKLHAGTDHSVPIGTPVMAADGGVVIDVENGCPINGYYGSRCGGGFGNLVFIRHQDGTVTRYAHLQAANVAIGQKVTRGQQIATSGNSGSSKGPHLHFEVRASSGEPLDPANHIGHGH